MHLEWDVVHVIVLVAELAFAISFGIWSHQNMKRSHEASARELLDSHTGARAEHRSGTKVDDYQFLLKRPNARPLKALGQLKLEELGSDASIRSALDRIETLTGLDPWEGKAATVKGVDLARFFTYVKENGVDLATVDLPSVVREVKALGGTQNSVQHYRRRSRVQLAVAGLILLLLPLHVGSLRRLYGALAAEPAPDSSVFFPGEDPTKNFNPPSESAARTVEVVPREDRDSVQIRAAAQQKRDEAVRREVTRTDTLMRAMDSTANAGGYKHAVAELREAQARMRDLRSQFPNGSPRELQDVMEALDQEIAAIVHRCEEERRWAITWKRQPPECP